MTGIADVSAYDMKPLRWFSAMNPEMDCIVYVQGYQSGEATMAISKAMEAWFESESDVGYGDAIAEALTKAQIPHVLLLPEWDGSGMSCVPEWDEWADSVGKSIVV